MNDDPVQRLVMAQESSGEIMSCLNREKFTFVLSPQMYRREKEITYSLAVYLLTL